MEFGPEEAVIYLIPYSGATKVNQIALTSNLPIGLICTRAHKPRKTVVSKFDYFAIDNGCFSQSNTFDLDKYLRFLHLWKVYQETCLFATAPDVVGNAEATWQRSKDVMPQIRHMGYKVALVAQDGLENMPVAWDEFDCLFVGGTTEWKLSEVAYELVQEAKQRGKWAHMGRCNSFRRLRAAMVAGYDSVDGTHIAFAPDRHMAEIVRWLQQLKLQPSLLQAS